MIIADIMWHDLPVWNIIADKHALWFYLGEHYGKDGMRSAADIIHESTGRRSILITFLHQLMDVREINHQMLR